MQKNTQAINIWRMVDGKPGHESQSLGFSLALQRRTACRIIDIPIYDRFKPLLTILRGKWPAGRTLSAPDLIIGAGHRTHLSMLAAKRYFGGRTIVIMQPSLPVAAFDLSLIPAHDNYRGGGQVLETRGVLNPLQSEGQHDPNKVVIMIGGPSKHFHWHADGIIAQIKQLTRQHPEKQFVLTTSRRTPAELVPALQTQVISNLQIVPFADTDNQWVTQQLANCGSAWISEDSVSMVYEALTAQVAVGILNLPVRHHGRVTRGIEQLIADQHIVRFDALGHYKSLIHPVMGFREADRCADWLIQHWLQPEMAPIRQPLPQNI